MRGYSNKNIQSLCKLITLIHNSAGIKCIHLRIPLTENALIRNDWIYFILLVIIFILINDYFIASTDKETTYDGGVLRMVFLV